MLKQQQASQSSEHPLRSFFPSVEDLEEISIDEGLPVMAFGLELPYFERWYVFQEYQINLTFTDS